MELEEYSQHLQFISEYQLTTEPLRIDVVIIKKTKDIVIKKNIASIFRNDNIVEYKSPDDNISVGDFYKVYGYACLYQSLNGEDIEEVTLTFVESRHPQELLKHLQERRRYTVEERWPGIYIISGDIMPIQIIDSRKLSGEENIWLKSLDNRLGRQELERIKGGILLHINKWRMSTYFDVIIRANKKTVLEVLKMGKSELLSTVEMICRESGLIEKWVSEIEAREIAVDEARGEERKAAEIAIKMLRNGFSMEQTADLSGLDVEKIKALSN
jgi:hypothetical protein